MVDDTNEQATDEYVDAVVEEAGHIDISFNLIGYGDVQEPLTEIWVDDFMRPITTAMRTQFLTTKAAARHMVERGSGVILFFGGGGPQTLPGLGGFKIALDAIEGLRRQWAVELGEHDIRVVTLKTGGITETIPEDVPGRDEIIDDIEEETLLNRTATLVDVGRRLVINEMISTQCHFPDNQMGFMMELILRRSIYGTTEWISKPY